MREGVLKVRAVIEGLEGIAQVDQDNVSQVREGDLNQFELYDLSVDPGETSPLSVEDSPLPSRLRNQYREALKTFHVWPAVQR